MRPAANSTSSLVNLSPEPASYPQISQTRLIFWQEGGIGQIDRVKLSLTIFLQSKQEIGGGNSIRDARFDDA